MKVSIKQFAALQYNSERWNLPDLLEDLEPVADEEIPDGQYVGFWTGGEAGEGMYLGIEKDGYTHS